MNEGAPANNNGTSAQLLVGKGARGESNTGLVLLLGDATSNIAFASRESIVAPNIAPKLIVH